jgi:uncharacterized membrane protein YdbT with pleckstrin-like domain
MPTFIESIVASDEYVYTVGRLSQWPIMWLYILGLLLVPVFGLGLLLWLVAYLKATTTEFAVTDRRVVLKQGWIERNVTELSLLRIESVMVYQSPIGRVLNFGDVSVIGTGHTVAMLKGVASPVALSQQLAKALEDRNIVNRSQG